MNQCMQSFFEFCPSDRIYFVFLGALLIGLGYIIGAKKTIFHGGTQ